MTTDIRTRASHSSFTAMLKISGAHVVAGRPPCSLLAAALLAPCKYGAAALAEDVHVGVSECKSALKAAAGCAGVLMACTS